MRISHRLNLIKMKLVLVFVFFQCAFILSTSCPPLTRGVQDMLAKNLWGVQTLRGNLINALSAMRSTADEGTYFSITALMDGLRHRHIDLYPIISTLPELQKSNPQQQLITILEIVEKQNFVSNAANELKQSLDKFKIKNWENLTENLEGLQTVENNKPLSFVFNLIRQKISTCQPSQNLVGGILINIPVRTYVTKARYEISQSLKASGLPDKIWTDKIQEIPIEGTLTNWLKRVIMKIAPLTNDPENVKKIANGVVIFKEEKVTGDNMGAERGRRSASIGDNLEPNLRILSRAIAEYTLSLIRRNQHPEMKIAPPRLPFYLSPQDLINQINKNIALQSEDGKTNVAIAFSRKNVQDNSTTTN